MPSLPVPCSVHLAWQLGSSYMGLGDSQSSCAKGNITREILLEKGVEGMGVRTACFGLE